MRGWGIWVLIAGVGGCCSSAPVAPRPAAPSMPPVTIELPHTTPEVPVLDGKGLPRLSPRTTTGPEGRSFRRLTEKDCLLLGAAHAGSGSLLDEEQSVPQPARKGDAPRDELRRTLRYYTALELRNRSASDALERFFQLAEAEARTDLLRSAFSILDPLLAKAGKPGPRTSAILSIRPISNDGARSSSPSWSRPNSVPGSSISI